MSEHGHHDPGGHELEAINTKLLFRLLISLSIITLLASTAVVQWFYGQRRELDARNASEGSFQLKEYKAKMAKDLEGIDRLTQEITSNPALLATPAPPPGWIHPDDLVGGGVVAAPEHAEPKPAEEEVAPVPVELPQPEGDAEGEAVPEGEGEAAPEGEVDAPKPEPAGDDAEPKPKQPKPKPEPAGDDAEPKPKQPKPKPEPAADGE